MNRKSLFLISVFLLLLTASSVSAQDNLSVLSTVDGSLDDGSDIGVCDVQPARNSEVVSISSSSEVGSLSRNCDVFSVSSSSEVGSLSSAKEDFIDHELLDSVGADLDYGLIESADANADNLLLADESAVDKKTINEEVPLSPISTIHTFSDLKKLLDNAPSGSKVVLSGTYKFNKYMDSSLKNGVKISKNLKIVGSPRCIIDGAGAARCLRCEKSCTISLENIIIRNGYVYQLNGGAIHVGEKTRLTIKKCTFKNNKAVNNDKKKDYANGGAIYLQEKAKVYIYDSIFSDNYVKNGNGGAIALQKKSYLEVHRSSFKKNTAKRSSSLSWKKFKRGMGGVIKTSIGCSVRLYDSTFKSNKAYVSIVLVVTKSHGGKKLSTLYVKNCNFENNYARKDGAIYLDEFGKGKILNSRFIKNRSPYGSGTLVFDTARKGSCIKNCKFTSNSVGYGGGICIRVVDNNPKYRAHVNIHNCRFTKNKAKIHGGGIFAYHGIVKVTRCTFLKNTAKNNGGALFFKSGKLTIKKSKFTRNVSKRFGGAIAYSTKHLKISKSKFTKNKSKKKKYDKIYKF